MHGKLDDVGSKAVSSAVPCLCLQGLAPIRYQWFRDSKRLTVATSNTSLLVLVDVAAADSGVYHCQVREQAWVSRLWFGSLICPFVKQ